MRGYNVVASAFDGAEAIRVYSKLYPKPDVVLMDHRMPVMNGIAAAKELLRINPSCKIIFLSADEKVSSPSSKGMRVQAQAYKAGRAARDNPYGCKIGATT